MLIRGKVVTMNSLSIKTSRKLLIVQYLGKENMKNLCCIFFPPRGKAVRFRWIQPTGYGKKQNWAVSRLYIGKGCPLKCNGHGKCTEGGCM